MIFNTGSGGAGTAEQMKYDNTESGLQADNVQGAIDEVTDSLQQVKTYVGSDGKLHFVDASGADSVLPFNSVKTGTFTSVKNGNATVNTGLDSIKYLLILNYENGTDTDLFVAWTPKRQLNASNMWKISSVSGGTFQYYGDAVVPWLWVAIP